MGSDISSKTLSGARRFGAAALDLALCVLPTLLLFPLWIKQGVPLAWVFAMFAFIHTAYCTVFVKLSGTTVGLTATGGRVTGCDGTRAGFTQALSRALSFWLGFLLLGLGWLSGLVREDKRFLHDLASFTCVVPVVKGAQS